MEVSGEVANTAEKPLAEPPVKAPEDGPEMDKLLKRAAKGDESCLPEVQALLADKERGAEWMEAAGSPAAWFRQSLVEKMGEKNVFAKEAARQKLARVRADLEGPNPTPIESLLAERASLCWFEVNWYEERFVNTSDMIITQADFAQRRIHRAHHRFLSVVESLARVRKMALPSVMVNIAKNQQVNVGETRE